MVLVFAGESHKDDEITRLRAELAAVTAERDRMMEALRLVISDIIDYERANKLYPNPGKQHCWQSVRDALVLLDGVKEPVANTQTEAKP